MILVTGATGFVGSKVLARLRQAGAGPVLALGRRPGPGITVCDLMNPRGADAPWDAVERVIHCAAVIPGRGRFNPFDNLLMTQGLLDRLAAAPLKALVLLSSVAVYPIDAAVHRVLLREDCSALPQTAYGRAKLMQEWWMQNFAEGRAPLAILRPSSVYGPGNTSRTLLPIFVEQAKAGLPLTLKGSRRYQQNFVHVDDVAEVAVTAALEARDGTFNLFSDETLTPARLAAKASHHFGGHSQIVDEQDDSPYPEVIYDHGRLTQAFGRTPRSLDLAGL